MENEQSLRSDPAPVIWPSDRAIRYGDWIVVVWASVRLFDSSVETNVKGTPNWQWIQIPVVIGNELHQRRGNAGELIDVHSIYEIAVQTVVLERIVRLRREGRTESDLPAEVMRFCLGPQAQSIFETQRVRLKSVRRTAGRMLLEARDRHDDALAADLGKLIAKVDEALKVAHLAPDTIAARDTVRIPPGAANYDARIAALYGEYEATSNLIKLAMKALKLQNSLRNSVKRVKP